MITYITDRNLHIVSLYLARDLVAAGFAQPTSLAWFLNSRGWQVMNRLEALEITRIRLSAGLVARVHPAPDVGEMLEVIAACKYTRLEIVIESKHVIATLYQNDPDGPMTGQGETLANALALAWISWRERAESRRIPQEKGS